MATQLTEDQRVLMHVDVTTASGQHIPAPTAPQWTSSDSGVCTAGPTSPFGDTANVVAVAPGQADVTVSVPRDGAAPLTAVEHITVVAGIATHVAIVVDPPLAK